MPTGTHSQTLPVHSALRLHFFLLVTPLTLSILLSLELPHLLTKVKRGLKVGVENVFRGDYGRVFHPGRQFSVGEVGHVRRGP